MEVKTIEKNTEERKGQRGLTLTEILIVLVILGGVMSLLAPRIFGQRQKANVRMAKLAIGKLSSSLEEFYSDCDQYPDSLDQLLSAPGDDVCESWGPDPYVKGEKALKDPWKNQFDYKIEGGNYVIVSFGKDGEPSGDGFDKDISSEDL